jgi:hypothetical protein
MGASQSSQPPSRHNSSRHGTADTKQHKQKAASISTPMKQQQQQQQPPVSPLPVIIDKPAPPRRVITPPAVLQSVPAPAVAVPIPGKRKPVSLPTSKDNSYVDQHKDTDLLHRFGVIDVKEMEEEMDEKEVQSKFGIAWVASDDFDDEYRNLRGTYAHKERTDMIASKKYPLEIIWSEGGHAVYVLGTFTERKALLLKKTWVAM